MRTDNQLGSLVYERADTFVDLITPDVTRYIPRYGRRHSWGYDHGSPQRRGRIITSSEGTVTITWGDEPLVGIETCAGTVVVWPDRKTPKWWRDSAPPHPAIWSVDRSLGQSRRSARQTVATGGEHRPAAAVASAP